MISGIILTSGDVQNVIGPNNATGTTTDSSMPGSPTLDALIPGTSTPVSVNNVNCGYASGANAAPGIGTNRLYYINNTKPTYTGLPDAQLDGLTTVLSMIADVNPNVTNHMFIGIADAGDGMLDSVVFIKGGGFSVCGGPGQPPSGGGGVIPEPSTSCSSGRGCPGHFISGRSSGDEAYWF